MMSNEDSPSAVVVAVHWLQAALVGSVATAAAVIAVAWIGLLMLTGRIELRRAASVILGCFILFGASSIAQGILAGLQENSTLPEVVEEPPPPSYPPVAPSAPKAAAPSAYDPYAGAAFAPRQ